MAENGRRILEQSKAPDRILPVGDQMLHSTSDVADNVDKEARLRSLKERQNEERQRKLEEIKAQALAAQVFKEQKENERRRRLDEMRMRDDSRRQQVEERKRAINDAERDRLEFIIKRNQEREYRMETKKRNERSNAVFAFGSSTPRMLEPSDMTSSYWGTRRATSIQNITSSVNSSSALTRRQSERDLDAGSKKRATSATGLERTAESSAPVIPAGCVSGYTGRRRTDLVPTIPTKDSISSSRKSLNHSPGRTYSMSRLDQLAKPRRRHDMPSLTESGSSHNLSPSSHLYSMTRSVSHIAVHKPRSRSELNKADSRSLQQLTERPAPPAGPPPRTTRTSQLREQKLFNSANGSEASSRPSSSLSQQSTNSVASSVNVRHRLNPLPRKPRPVSIAVTGVTHEIKSENRPPLPKPKKPIQKSNDKILLKIKAKTPVDSLTKPIIKSSAVKDDKGSGGGKDEKTSASKDEVKKCNEKVNDIQKSDENSVPPSDPKPTDINGKVESDVVIVPQSNKSDIVIAPENKLENNINTTMEFIKRERNDEVIEVKEVKKETTDEVPLIDIRFNDKEMTPEKQVIPNSNVDKIIEEEKPTPQVLVPQIIEKTEKTETQDQLEIENDVNNEMTSSMTKSRITTEEEAKAALAERRRLIREEAERQAELERVRIEEAARAELERQQQEEEQVRQLIELQRHTEEERLQEAIREAQKREEEERLKREEEQRQKVLKEEAEKKAREEAEKQKAELQERLKNEEKEREARRKRVEAIMLRTRGKNNANLSSQSTDDKNENKADEIKSSVESKVNGTKLEQQENGTNTKDIVDNLIPNEIVKNANTVTIESMNSNDSINSNNAWRDNQQYDSLM